MKLPANVLKIRARYVAKFPVPSGTPDTIDELAREWSFRFAEQVRFDTKDATWGMKRADPGRPIGKDSIARNDTDGLKCWDLLLGTGTGSPSLIESPDAIDIPGQVFVVVPAVNHLGPVVVVPPPPPVPVGKTLADYFTFRDLIVKLYQEELGRSIIADPDALVNWTFHWRENNATESQIRGWIRESDEWKAKHP